MQDKCSFCGRNRNEVNLLIAGTDGFICDECASQAYDIVQFNLIPQDSITQ